MLNNSYIYRFVAVFMAILILVSSIGFTIDQHFCGGQLKSFSLIGKAKDCYELATGEKQLSCPNHNIDSFKGLSISKKRCCENRTEHFQSDTEVPSSISNILNVDTQQFIVAYISVFITRSLLIPLNGVHLSYKPPIIYSDIPILIQSFLL